jgi:hydrogenase maturation protein HypF
MAPEKNGLRIRAGGIVQGVGFRPFIFNLAERNQLTGWVKNTSSGIEIELAGGQPALQSFVESLRTELPPLARIDWLETEICPPGIYPNFEIQASQPIPGEFLPVSPDVSICPDCQRELFDPGNRRFRYPFINCTNCGPRFSIIRDIPYDRPNTTMAGFPLCPDCGAEYHSPRDRRFHAQPVACPICGPQVSLESQGQQLGQGESAIRIAREWLKRGKIIAIKGLGGYHLACDAANPEAVATLRRRKKRSDKPFALMGFDMRVVERYCTLTAEERDLLISRERPVVLVEPKPGVNLALQEVAPGLTHLGIMLAYTPLHLLLLQPEPGFPELVVMTSGNSSEEPIAFQDSDALERLDGLADAFLLHNREIHTRIDDSVVSVSRKRTFFLRRARGYAPGPLVMPSDLPQILATGPELKNTFCLTRDRYAFLSHHIGDMENLETYESFEQGIQHYELLFRIHPELVACDLHPNYLSTRYAEVCARERQLPLIKVQHHHAHLAACLADNGWDSPDPVIGLSYDGTGLGTDGAIWGSEVLLGGYTKYERRFHLAYVPLAGGDLAVRKPARMALAHLWQAGLEWEADIPPVRELCETERTLLNSQLVHKINAPLTSSMGRLFDAAAALIGIRQIATYEAQAAIEMEAAADPNETGCYPFSIDADTINPVPMWEKLLADWHNGAAVPVMAARFHNTVAALSEEVCQILRRDTGCGIVALSGGVWQNRLLLGKTLQRLEKAKFSVLVHQRVPANDGGVALGQAMVAAWQMKR